ncbi:MAG: hypothetical protein HYU25_08505 [Candidatus Rokubacteria bacterium]|nr:hypothetical protein [Candidatus Rokubacteria bacterium]
MTTAKKRLMFPFARLEVRPTADDPITKLFVDKELASEGFTYVLQSGREGTVHIEDVLEYNQDPDDLRDQLLYRLTLEAQKRIAATPLARREIIRRLGTSPTQLYRLLDQTNYRKATTMTVKVMAHFWAGETGGASGAGGTRSLTPLRAARRGSCRCARRAARAPARP